MKSLFLSVFVMCFALLAANPVREYPLEQRQPDGSKISIFVSGDELDHRMHDDRGYTILIHPRTGYAVYAVPDNDDLIASDYIVGKADPATLNISPGLLPSRALALERVRSLPDNDNGSDSRAPTTGMINNIVIFIRFLDQNEYTEPISDYSAMFNSDTAPSMKDFFLEDSSNQLSINTTFYPAAENGFVRSFQDGHVRAYFSPYNAATNPIGYTSTEQGYERIQAMLRTAVNTVSPFIPSTTQFDMNNDGLVDNVTFVVQGDPDPQHLSMLWPQFYYLYLGPNTYINGKRVFDFNFLLSNTIDSGVASHEMSHTLGFPDLYHYVNNGVTPVGAWDLMASHGAVPQQHMTYLKWMYGGWFNSIPTITPTGTPTTYTLTALDQNPNSCYRIASTVPNQFYVLEYRRDTGDYESGVPGSGLLIYRVCTGVTGQHMEGNRFGPPDEVYVYRPGGNYNTSGDIANAHFSSSWNRSSIHNLSDPNPWLYHIVSTEQIDGNLIVSDISSAGETTISFKVGAIQPNVWLGTVSSDWHTAANWSYNSVPTSTTWVEIPHTEFVNGVGEANAVMITGIANARKITIQDNSLFIGDGSLTVYGDIESFSEIRFIHDDAVLDVQGNMILHPGSETKFYADAILKVLGNLEFQQDTYLYMNTGYIEFYGTGNSYITTLTTTYISQLYSSKNYPYAVYISDNSTTSLYIGSLYVFAGSTVRQNYLGTTYLGGDIHVFDGGYLALDHGTFHVRNAGITSIDFGGTDSYLNHLVIEKHPIERDGPDDALVELDSNIMIKGNLDIIAGTLYASWHTIKLAGSWNNAVGIEGFWEGAGTVMFFGNANQSISSEDFNRLELNKTGGFLNIPAGSTVTCDHYNWTAGAYSVSGGSFTAYDLDDIGIMGNVTLTGGNIDYHQDAASFVDLRGNLTITNGTFNIFGGSSDAYFSYIDAASLTISGGVMDVKDQGILIPDMFSFTDNISGGTIRTTGSFTVERTDFNPTGGLVELYGTGDHSVQTALGSVFYDLRILKGSTREMSASPANSLSKNPDSGQVRSNSIVAESNLRINGTLSISNGIFDVNSNTISVGNDLDIWSTLKMLTSGCIVDVNDDVAWHSSATSNISSGYIYCGGNWLFDSGCTATLTGSTVRLDSSYGCTLTNLSQNARFGHLEIYGTDEEPVTNYVSGSHQTLRIDGFLKVYPGNTLNLNEFPCTIGGYTMIYTNATLELGEGGSITINSYLDLLGNLISGLGSVTVHGEFTTYDSSNIMLDHGSLVVDAPWLDMRSNYIYLNGAVTILSGTLEITEKLLVINANPTRIFDNALIKVGGGFSATATGCYHPTGGELRLIGARTATAISVSNGNYIYRLALRKSNNNCIVYLQSDLTISGNTSITLGYLNSNGHNISSGNISINGILDVNTASVLSITPGQSLTVNNRGTLILSGSSLQPVIVTRNASPGYYGFTLAQGSTISAANAIFEYMNSSGINIQAGATVKTDNSFTNCTFRNGSPGGKLLWIDNSQNISINGANFPANTWSGTYNVAKTTNQGNVSITNYTGTFSGASFEQDAYNRISWQANGAPSIQNLEIAQAGNTIQLNWSYPYTFIRFKIYRSTSPTGNFSYIGQALAPSWSEPATSTRYFYKVTAEQ